jgi:hypothetical protein
MSGTGRIQLATMRQMVAILRGSMTVGRRRGGGGGGGGGREEAARRCPRRGRRCWSNQQVGAGLWLPSGTAEGGTRYANAGRSQTVGLCCWGSFGGF